MGGKILGNEKEKTGTAGGRPGGGGVKGIGALAIQPLWQPYPFGNVTRMVVLVPTWL